MKKKETDLLQKKFDRLFVDAHGYLDKGHKLAITFIPKSQRSAIRAYETVFRTELHLLDNIFKKHPELRSTFNFRINKGSENKAMEIYYKLLNDPPSDLKGEEICLFKAIFEGIHVIKLFEDLSKKASNKVILEHSVIAMCTAYEIYCRDSLAWVLNNLPEYGKRYIGKSSIPLKELAKFGYDPLGKAGDIFFEKECQAFKIFENGKKCYTEILGFELFEDKKTEKTAWKIFQTRHCIIHNGGKPDTRWKRKTGKKKLDLTPKTLMKYVEFIHDLFHTHYARLYIKLFNSHPTYVELDEDVVKKLLPV